jgi:hypothetical protein
VPPNRRAVVKWGAARAKGGPGLNGTVGRKTPKLGLGSIRFGTGWGRAAKAQACETACKVKLAKVAPPRRTRDREKRVSAGVTSAAERGVAKTCAAGRGERGVRG